MVKMLTKQRELEAGRGEQADVTVLFDDGAEVSD